MTVIRLFIRDFYRAMGDREVHLAAYRDAALTLLAIGVFLGLTHLAQLLPG